MHGVPWSQGCNFFNHLICLMRARDVVNYALRASSALQCWTFWLSMNHQSGHHADTSASAPPSRSCLLNRFISLYGGKMVCVEVLWV